MRRIAVAVGFCMCAPVMFAQQPLERVFRVDAGTTFEWFATDSTTRGMAVVPGGSLLVPDRVPENAIYRLDAETGELIGRMKTEGISGGAFAVNKIDVAADGAIYVANLVTGNDTFKLYYYSDEQAVPVSILEYQVPTSYRMGDGLAVIGKGASTKILVTGSENKEVLIVTDPDGDGKFQARVVTPTAPELVGVQEPVWSADGGTFWLRQSSRDATYAHEHRVTDGAGTGRSFGRAVNYGAIDVVSEPGKYIAAVAPGYFGDQHPNPLPGLLFAAPGADQRPTYATENLLANGGANGNLNASSSAVIDLDRRRVYFLVPNNSISSWKLPAITSGL